MDKTLFAGLTQLAPTEPLSLDDYSFQSVNPYVIDRLLEVGAVTHHHDGHAALADPVDPLDAALIIGGGQIPSDQTIEFVYTLIDAYRGETKASPVKAVTTRSKIQEPEFGPIAVADYTAGSLPPDTYYYGLTYVDGVGGETTLGAITVINVEAGHANARVLLSGLTSGMALASAAGWKLYKAVGGSDFSFCASGSTDTFEDNAACVDGLQPPPTLNSTQRYASIEVYIPVLPAGATGYKLYGTTQSGVFDTFSFLASGSTLGETVVLTSFSPTYGKPPTRSLALPGASKINPETDIANWHWRTPVANYTDLPGGSLGDVKLVTSTGEIYAVLTASTSAPSGWTNVAPSGTVKHVSASGGTRVSSPSEIIFEGASGTAVIVTRVGGSAKVLIGGGTGGAGTDTDTVVRLQEQDGSPSITPLKHLEFSGGSGNAGVRVVDLGGGSARVEVGASAAAGINVRLSEQDGTPSVTPLRHVLFGPGSGGVGMKVTDLGGGSALVEVGGTPAVGGGGGGTSNLLVREQDGSPSIQPTQHLEFGAGSGQVGVRIVDLGGGSARVEVGGGGATYGGGSGSATTEGYTYGLMGTVQPAVGDTDFIPPFFIALPPNASGTIRKVRHRVNSGQVRVKLQKNGVDLAGYSDFTVTTSTGETVANEVVTADDRINLVVLGASGAAKNLSATLNLDKDLRSTVIRRDGHTFAIGGGASAFAAPDTNALPGYFVTLVPPPQDTGRVLKMRHKVGSGAVPTASAYIKLQKNGVDMTGFAASATLTPASTTPAAVTVVDDDLIELVVVAVGGSPRNLSVTVVEEITSLHS